MALATDSFCERCGNRYVFSPSGPRPLSLKGARVLARGLKNFVLTDGQSISEAINLARLDYDLKASSRIDQVFHKTFNFCMTCRQYACDRCWNSKVGACLSCAPEDSVEPVAPEEHLIVRTPVARRDSDWPLEDWPLEPNGPMVESIVRPVQDLRSDGHQVAAGAGRSARRSAGKASDPGAWTLWPVADEISPEMTLTPEELEIVETQLGRAQLAGPVGDEPEAAMHLPVAQGQEIVEPGPEPEVLAAEAGARPDQIEAQTGVGIPDAASVPTEAAASRDEPATGPTDESAAGAAIPEPHRLLRITPASADLPPLTSPTSRAAPVPATKPAVSMMARLFGRGARSEAPAGRSWPHATPWADRPTSIDHGWSDGAAIVDAAPEADAQLTTTYPSPEQAALPAVGPNPVPAAAEADEAPLAPLAGLPTFAGSTPAAVAGTGDIPAQITSPEAEPDPAPSAEDPGLTAAEAGATSTVDPQEAVAMRLSAVAADSEGGSKTAAPEHDASQIWAGVRPEPAFDPAPFQPPLLGLPPAPGPDGAAAPLDMPGQVEADLAAVPVVPSGAQPLDRTEVAWADPSAAVPQPSKPSTPEQPGPAPWPPLGARWPTPRKPLEAWPAPDAAPVAALVAARQFGAPAIAEMWAQSAQEVLSHGSVRACRQCALPVSTHARFCRRCGAQQA